MSTVHACALSAGFMSFLLSLTCNDKMSDCDQILNGIFSYNLTKLKQLDLSTLCIVGDLHRRDRQYLSSSHLTGGGVHATHQDRAPEADGRGGHVPRCQ